MGGAAKTCGAWMWLAEQIHECRHDWWIWSCESIQGQRPLPCLDYRFGKGCKTFSDNKNMGLSDIGTYWKNQPTASKFIFNVQWWLHGTLQKSSHGRVCSVVTPDIVKHFIYGYWHQGFSIIYSCKHLSTYRWFTSGYFWYVWNFCSDYLIYFNFMWQKVGTAYGMESWAWCYPP